MSAVTPTPSYFLISVSTRENLDLCVKYALAGFPGGESGAWTFSEISEGDLISFLYGARAHNLYRVAKKEALADADTLPPWKPLLFVESKKVYYFPFRLQLEPIRTFSEAIIRTEFFYVAENLLLRGGYRKSHFQADQTTLQYVSEMGSLADPNVDRLSLPAHSAFALGFSKNKAFLRTPEVCRFQETILQSAIRHHLMVDSNLRSFLNSLQINEPNSTAWEILGEKAIMQGHIDLLIKERVPIGSTMKIPIEVKTKRAMPDDLDQIRGYMDELSSECKVGVLLAADFNKRVVADAKRRGVVLIRYSLNVDLNEIVTFEQITSSLKLELVT